MLGRQRQHGTVFDLESWLDEDAIAEHRVYWVLEPTLLQRMVENLDGKVYRHVFAFGLEELQAISTLTGEGAQERIFSAAGAGRSVREVQRDLAKEIEVLWRPRSRLYAARGQRLRQQPTLRRVMSPTWGGTLVITGECSTPCAPR